MIHTVLLQLLSKREKLRETERARQSMSMNPIGESLANGIEIIAIVITAYRYTRTVAYCMLHTAYCIIVSSLYRYYLFFVLWLRGAMRTA
mmetsp:Transcript_3087/g.8494  ORF Transcript_3087/g.8494 Transcript_3087/m.8494 type:complete len:90 (-) Transcript_3087:356-625(-)